MTSFQYEELCRHFLAEQLQMSVDEIVSVIIPNPTRQELCHHSHQIDLYWETWDFLTCYLNIANAKWRSKGLVRQAEVMLLQQVRLKVGAHKAIMITNRGFSRRAWAAARDDGIGLLIVRPELDSSKLARTGPEIIRRQIQEVAGEGKPLYTYEIERKGLATDGALWKVLGLPAEPSAGAGRSGPAGDWVPPAGGIAAPPNKAMGGASLPTPNRGFGPYTTLNGPGSGFITK